MWRLRTTDERQVNVFDHSDPLRDQKSLLQGAGYLDIFEAMDHAQVDRWDTFPIQVELVSDGAFWKVVRINKRAEDAIADAPFTPAEDDEPTGPLARLTKVIKSGNFVILDTETTGLYDDAEICQIAIISSTGETLLDTLVKTKYPIPEQATRIHGITNEHLISAPRWLDIRNEVWDCLFGKTVITYNAAYDFKLLTQTEQATNASSQWDWTTLGNQCAMLAYAEHRGIWNEYHDGYKWHKLTDAAARIGYTLPAGMKAHSALSDCLMCLAVCQHLTSQG
jgi:DNA polymerase-3 subunit epsilon